MILDLVGDKVFGLCALWYQDLFEELLQFILGSAEDRLEIIIDFSSRKVCLVFDLQYFLFDL